MVIVVAAALTSMVAVVCAAWAQDEAVEPARQVRAWLLEDEFADKR